jgi:hypothetical protein
MTIMLKAEPTRVGSRPLPDSFQGTNVPPALYAAERGDFTSLPSNGQRYELSGGSGVEVYRWSGYQVYGAVVTLDHGYPGVGKIAVNVHRTEKITVIEGSVTLEINGQFINMKPHTFAVVTNSDAYAITGKGRLVVTVLDSDGGTSRIVARKAR